MQDFKKLKVWRKAHELTLLTYKAASYFPDEEKFGITSQMKRCSVSIASNIVEGSGRNLAAQCSHFLNIALGSACELQYQILLSRDLNIITESQHAEFDSLIIEIKKMIWSLNQSLRNH